MTRVGSVSVGYKVSLAAAGLTPPPLLTEVIKNKYIKKCFAVFDSITLVLKTECARLKPISFVCHTRSPSIDPLPTKLLKRLTDVA